MQKKSTSNQGKTSLVKSIHIENLKGVRDLELPIGENLTCLIGANGVGKSTILHSLACAYTYNDVEKGIGKEKKVLFHRLSEFFTPYSGQSWKESKFTLSLEEASCDGMESLSREIVYQKKGSWSPKRAKKRVRATVYIGLSTCVPAIEAENSISKITMDKVDNPEKKGINEQIRKRLSDIMNKDYTEVFTYRHNKKEYLGVSEKPMSNETGNKSYSSLSMSAGEQRCIQILWEVMTAPYNSLILIEEIDILLHQRALLRLIAHLQEIARKQHHQIVFSCHNPAIKDAEHVDFRCLQKDSEGKTVCFEGFVNYDLFSLTGKRDADFVLYVEDMLSEAIVKQLLKQKQLQRKVHVVKIGACQNAFALVAGLHLSGREGKPYLVILDGDVYKTADEKLKQMNKVRTGSGAVDGNKKLIERIIGYNLPVGKPEEYIIKVLKKNRAQLKGNRELVEALMNCGYETESHQKLYTLFEYMGYENSKGYEEVAELLSQTEEFKSLTQPVSDALDLFFNIK